jgi:hypothetical protein
MTTKIQLKTIHLLLSVQTIVIILGSANRLGSVTRGFVSANEFLRWVDLINMLPLPLLSVAAFYVLKKQIEQSTTLVKPAFGTYIAVNLIFVLGVYLLGAGYGDHEVTNYLHERFCNNGQNSDLCRIIIYNDDDFSHYIFFIGFVMINTGIMLTQALYGGTTNLSMADIGLLILNALFIAAGIVANLAFEEIGLDLYVVAFITALAVLLFVRHGALPLLVYYTCAYVLGLTVTTVLMLR